MPRFISRPTPTALLWRLFSCRPSWSASPRSATRGTSSLMLAARFLRPVPIIFGILLATIANHAAAGLAGTFFGPYSAYRGCGGYWGFHS